MADRGEEILHIRLLETKFSQISSEELRRKVENVKEYVPKPSSK
jgi:hypothetical protein